MTAPGRKIRVMVVDDAVVARLVLSEALLADPGLQLAAVAENGQQALAQLDDAAPDVVVLDVEMPVLDGLSTLRALRAGHPDLPVIMFSTLTAAGEDATREALQLGANDYVTKPSASGREEAVRVLREQLLPKIKALVPARPAAGTTVPAPRAAVPTWRPTELA
jgi:two-component system chemotaxis response regulator CheB